MKQTAGPVDERTRLQKQFSIARANLVIMTALTCVNIAMIALETGRVFQFSAATPQLAFIVFSNGDAVQKAAGLLISVLIIGLFALCYVLSKRNPLWMTAALVLFVCDTAFLVVWLVAVADNLLANSIEVLYHVWVLYYLIRGVQAAHRLRALPEQTAEAFAGTEPAAAATTGPVATQQPPASAPPMPETPLGAYQGGGERLLSALQSGLYLEVFRSDTETALVVDGQVYDRWSGALEQRYTLTARVCGIPIVCTYTTTGAQTGLMRLYADGRLADECERGR